MSFCGEHLKVLSELGEDESLCKHSELFAWKSSVEWSENSTSPPEIIGNILQVDIEWSHSEWSDLESDPKVLGRQSRTTLGSGNGQLELIVMGVQHYLGLGRIDMNPLLDTPLGDGIHGRLERVL